jgi:hypothetical protein
MIPAFIGFCGKTRRPENNSSTTTNKIRMGCFFFVKVTNMPETLKKPIFENSLTRL